MNERQRANNEAKTRISKENGELKEEKRRSKEEKAVEVVGKRVHLLEEECLKGSK
jgi:hypothetical protein